MENRKIRVAIALIYNKAVTPGYFIVEMRWDVWRRFLFASQRVRQEMVVPKLAPNVESKVRELVWIPLDNQDKLRVIDEKSMISLE